MTEMLEKIARAIHNREYEDDLAPHGTAEHALFIEVARAAVEAMREPSEAAQRAWSTAVPWAEGDDPNAMVPVPGTGQGDLQHCPQWQLPWFALDLWKRHNALIDAILKEESGPAEVQSGAGPPNRKLGS